MLETSPIVTDTHTLWSQQLQRRVIRLLLQHDAPLLRSRFRLFSEQSTLPPIPLLQQYDHYIKLQVLSNDLLDDILPRIRRQLSLKTTHTRLLEESPTRGDIDWQRSIERGWSQTPGQPPQQFETRLRQRAMDTPENILVVAILLTLQQELAQAMNEGPEDEELNQQEKQFFASTIEKVECELAAAYARALIPQARQTPIPTLVQQVARQLKPGPGPYRDLLHWWERFTQFRVGRAQDKRTLTLAATRQDEKTDAWLYELWIALEIIHLLSEEGAIQSQDIKIATDLLQCTFTWQQRRFRFIYNRQLDTTTSYQPAWEHGPTSRPDYTIEREEPLTIQHNQQLIWREPAVVLDAKYYLNGSDPTNTHQPIKKLLGDMTLLGATIGALFFPTLPEPAGEQQSTRIIRRNDQRYYAAQQSEQQVHLYHLDPSLPFTHLQQRLRAILDLAATHLPERQTPTCQGTLLNTATTNAAQVTFPERTVLCPKPHIGPGVFDIVNLDTDCLHNPYRCHVMQQAIVKPFVVNATTRTETP
jgi:hypothetical protein